MSINITCVCICVDPSTLGAADIAFQSGLANEKRVGNRLENPVLFLVICDRKTRSVCEY